MMGLKNWTTRFRVALVLSNIALIGVFASAVSLFYRHATIIEQPPIREGFLQWHQELIAGTLAAPYQWRILYAWFLEGLHRLSGIDVLSLDKVSRVFIYYVTLCSFWGYLRRWFDDAQSLVGTLFLAAIFPLALDVYNYYTPDYLNLFLFVLTFWLIRERKWPILIPLIGLATLNRETIVFSLIPLALYGWRHRDQKYWWTLLGCIVAFLVAYIGIRLLYPRTRLMEYP